MSNIVRALAILSVVVIVGQPRTSWAQSSAGAAPKMEAKLVNPEKNAPRQTATVQVTVQGVEIVDPASVAEKPQKGQGHLHYRVDDGPVIATTSLKLSFHDLTPGDHRIVVMLAANDHSPLGPEAKLSASIPQK